MKAPMFQTHTYVYLYVTMRFQNVPRSIQQAIQQELLVMAIFLTRCPPRPREEMRRVDQRNYRWCNCILLPFVLIERLLFILFQRGPGGISASGAAMISFKKDQTGEIPSVMSASLRSIPIRWVETTTDGGRNSVNLEMLFLVKRRKGESLEKSCHTSRMCIT